MARAVEQWVRHASTSVAPQAADAAAQEAAAIGNSEAGRALPLLIAGLGTQLFAVLTGGVARAHCLLPGLLHVAQGVMSVERLAAVLARAAAVALAPSCPLAAGRLCRSALRQPVARRLLSAIVPGLRGTLREGTGAHPPHAYTPVPPLPVAVLAALPQVASPGAAVCTVAAVAAAGHAVATGRLQPRERACGESVVLAAAATLARWATGAVEWRAAVLAEVGGLPLWLVRAVEAALPPRLPDSGAAGAQAHSHARGRRWRSLTRETHAAAAARAIAATLRRSILPLPSPAAEAAAAPSNDRLAAFARIMLRLCARDGQRALALLQRLHDSPDLAEMARAALALCAEWAPRHPALRGA